MKTRTVRELMVQIDEYATVSKGATLYETVMALEKAQQDFNRNQYPHRAVLVFDENNDVVGKISQLDILRALEPKYENIAEKGGSLARLGFSNHFQKTMIEQFNLWNRPFSDICKKAANLKAGEFMYTPSEGEYVEAKATLDEAIHQLVMGHHQSLLVTDNKKIVGILRLTDVFMGVFETIVTECKP